MRFDWIILEWIEKYIKSDFLDGVIPVVTGLGDSGLIWIIFGLILVLNKKYRRQGFLVWIGLLLGVVFGNVIIKNLVARPRPFVVDPSIQLLIEKPSEFSFPSGHTLSSTIAATILTMTNKKFGIIAIPIAIAIAFSRLYLQVHYPTDILGGVVLGLIIGCLTYKIGMKIKLTNIKKTID